MMEYAALKQHYFYSKTFQWQAFIIMVHTFIVDVII